MSCQAKVLLRELEDVSTKLAASARDHADKSKALQQRVVKLVGPQMAVVCAASRWGSALLIIKRTRFGAGQQGDFDVSLWAGWDRDTTYHGLSVFRQRALLDCSVLRPIFITLLDPSCICSCVCSFGDKADLEGKSTAPHEASLMLHTALDTLKPSFL